MKRARVAALVAAWAAALGPAAGQPVGTPAPDRAFTLGEFWDAARVQRVDVVMIGDSNQVFQSHGWEAGWIRALDSRFGIYATGLMGAGVNNGLGAGDGEGYVNYSIGQNQGYVFTGVPAALARYGAGMTQMQQGAFVPAGRWASGGSPNGVELSRGGPVDPSSRLRYWMVMGQFDVGQAELPVLPPPRGAPAGPRRVLGADRTSTIGVTGVRMLEPVGVSPVGFYRAGARSGLPPFGAFLPGERRHTGARETSLVTRWIELRADASRTAPVNFRWQMAGSGESVIGPFYMRYHRVEEVETARGAAVSTLLFQGGRSLRTMAEIIRGMGAEAIDLYFSKIRELQPERKHVLIRINSGLNDRNERLASVGPRPALPGNSAAAFEDNAEAIIDSIRAVWTRNGWPQRELSFLVTVSHPVREPDDASLIQYRLAAQRLAARRTRVASVRLDQLTTRSQMVANGWYAPGFPIVDENHLSRAGALGLADLELGHLVARGCPLDYTGDGTFSEADATLFINLLIRFDPAADFDGDGAVNGADASAFNARAALGCP